MYYLSVLLSKGTVKNIFSFLLKIIYKRLASMVVPVVPLLPSSATKQRKDMKSTATQKQVIEAHMEGQRSAGCADPSWSEAFAYWTKVNSKKK